LGVVEVRSVEFYPSFEAGVKFGSFSDGSVCVYVEAGDSDLSSCLEYLLSGDRFVAVYMHVVCYAEKHEREVGCYHFEFGAAGGEVGGCEESEVEAVLSAALGRSDFGVNFFDADGFYAVGAFGHCDVSGGFAEQAAGGLCSEGLVVEACAE